MNWDIEKIMKYLEMENVGDDWVEVLEATEDYIKLESHCEGYFHEIVEGYKRFNEDGTVQGIELWATDVDTGHYYEKGWLV